jgi:hypothetical protein
MATLHVGTITGFGHMAPAYYAPGKWMHGIRQMLNGTYRAFRANCTKYGIEPIGSANFPDKDAALAWCQSDYDTLNGIGSTKPARKDG